MLDKLRSRLKDRSGLTYVEDDYDALAQPRDVREVALSEQDVQLMWNLLDYAALSSSEFEAPQKQAELESSVANPGSADTNMAYDTDDFPRPDMWAEDMTVLQDPQTMGEDWRLFGQPWSAYFPPSRDLWQV